MNKYRVAIDVGGTFTDVYAYNEKNKDVYIAKTLSTPLNPEQGIINGLEKINISGENITFFSHGTTVGTNALIERKLPKTALITTKGFRDIPEIRRGTRLDLWDNYKDVAPSYIKRRDRFEINERIDYSGLILKEVNEEEVKKLAIKLKKRNVESIAICLINSYISNENEIKIKKILEKELPNIYICASSEILPEIFEHERMSTTIINAVLGPILGKYMNSLTEEMRIKGYEGDILVLHSGGGVMTGKTVPYYAARVASSGIAAGAIASKSIAQSCGFNNAISLDMGGTSADISLMADGVLEITKDWYIEYGYPIGFPSIDIKTIGAGGGSITSVDEGGSLRNGPHSAGADPGPVCYDLGGKSITNTDANLILGRLNEKLLDGDLSLNKESALKMIQPICEKFGYNEYEAANAILKLANSNMSDALRLVSVQKGYDPRDFALVSFGGAGALHSAYLAKELSIPNVVVPPHPGVAAAMGCLLVDIVHDISETYVTNIDNVKKEEIEIEFNNMEQEAVNLLIDEKVSKDDMSIIRYIEVRYSGQWRNLSININDSIESMDNVKEKFHEEHERAFSYSNPNQAVEIYGLRIEAIGTVPKPLFLKERPSGTINSAFKEYRDVYFEESGGFINTPIYNRENLPVESQIAGPSVLEQRDSTVLIPPEFEAKVDEYKNVIISLKTKEV